MENQWSRYPSEEVIKAFGSTADGLAEKDVKKRLKLYGENVFEKKKKNITLGIILNQLKNPISSVLALAGLTLFFIDQHADAILILIVFLINMSIGITQEEKASNTFSKLIKKQSNRSLVYRDGKLSSIETRLLVTGDVILIKEGAIVPADARILEEEELKIDESVLTGEWGPVSKHAFAISSEKPISEQMNMLWKGSSVLSGEGKAIVIATGKNTRVGMIASSLSSVIGNTPIKKDIKKLVKMIVILLLLSLSLILIFGYIRGVSLAELLFTSVAVAIGAIPSGLPAAITLVLAIGMQEVFKKGGLIRNLFAAETLGATSWILTDKTGTLTEGKMELKKILTFDTTLEHIGGYKDRFRKILKDTIDGTGALSACVEGMSGDRMLGSPIEHALVASGIREGLNMDVLCGNKEYRTDYLPFSSKRRYSAGIIKGDDSSKMVVVGAPGDILKFSKTIETDEGAKTISGDRFDRIQKKIETETKNGGRTIAMAIADVPYEKFEIGEKTSFLKDSDLELNFIGVLCFEDLIRVDVVDSIEEIKKSNVRVTMVTGDNAETALYIAKESGISQEQDANVIVGDQFKKMSDEDVYAAIQYTHVFARMLPEQKLRLLKILQNMGQIVAMTGDGVNDAPALERAAIGISLESATDVAKESADLIMLKNSFSTIHDAIIEGRRIIINLKKIVIYILSTAFSETIVIGGAIIAGLPLPLTPAQILWANIIEEAFIGFGFAFEKSNESIKGSDPKSVAFGSIITRGVKKSILVLSIASGLFLLAVFVSLSVFTSLGEAEIRTIIFTALSLDSIFFAFSLKNLYGPIQIKTIFDNKKLIVAILISLMFLVVALFVQPIREFLDMGVFPLWAIYILPILAAFHLLLIETVKKIFLYSEEFIKK